MLKIQVMKQLILLLLVCASFLQAAAQKTLPVSLHITARGNSMVYDRLKQFIHGGAGAGIQLYYNAKGKVKPLLEINADLFSVNKILLVFEDGSAASPKNTVTTALAGIAFNPVKNIEAGFIAGPSFIEGNVYAGIKPFAGYYFGNRQMVKAIASLTHVFERDNISQKSSGFISLGIAVKLF